MHLQKGDVAVPLILSTAISDDINNPMAVLLRSEAGSLSSYDPSRIQFKNVFTGDNPCTVL